MHFIYRTCGKRGHFFKNCKPEESNNNSRRQLFKEKTRKNNPEKLKYQNKESNAMAKLHEEFKRRRLDPKSTDIIEKIEFAIQNGIDISDFISLARLMSPEMLPGASGLEVHVGLRLRIYFETHGLI